MKNLSALSTFLALSFASAAGSLAAAEPDLTRLPPPADKTGLTYAKDIRPLFEASCLNCHGERRQRAGLRLDSLEAVLKGSDEIKVVVPGKSKESPLVIAIAQLDDETAMPPKRARGGFGGFGGGGGPGGPGGPRQGAGGPNGPGRGGGGGFGGMTSLAPALFAQADKNKDGKLARAEFTGLADTWFDRIDSAKAGKVDQETFGEGLDDVLPEMQFGGGGFGGGRGPGGQRGGNEGMGFGPGRFVGPGLFAAADANKDASVTRAELNGLFGQWYDRWDARKSDAISEEQFRDGFAAAMPRPSFRGGGFGGMRGFGFGRGALAQEMLSQGDKDKDQKLTKAEFSALADAWFDKLDSDKTAKLTREQFIGRFGGLVGLSETAAESERGPSQRDPAPRPGGGPGFEGPRGGGAAFMAAGLFAAADVDKDESLTRGELKATFEKWVADFDSEKSGGLTEETLSAGLRSALPQQQFGGFGGAGGAGGRGPGGPAGFGGGFGPAPKPLTAEEVGLVRAWIDQGAK